MASGGSNAAATAAATFAESTADGHGSAGTTSPMGHAVVARSGGLAFRMITVGKAHTCGLDTHGIGYCWGANLRGELGTGSLSNSVTPVRVADRP